MTAYPGWTPASRPGIVPLHPLSFGTILGRSFTALRQNPKVMLGFALCVQVVGYVVMILAVGGVALWSYARLDTLREGTEEWQTVFVGSTALTIVAGVVFGLAIAALTVIVQGVVVAEVSREVVAEKQTLGQLWRQVKPVFWRLLGYTVLVTLAVSAVLGVVIAALVGLGIMGNAATVIAIILGVLTVLAAIPLSLWLSTKLLLVPAVLVIERTGVFAAMRRSWTLTRGRFWPALGVIIVISLTMSFAAQLVSLPFSILTSGITTVIAPTGSAEPSAIVALLIGTLLTQVVVLLIQSVAVVVQSTAMSLIYVDCRMRQEGLDIDLLEYVERRDAGERNLRDPYTPHPDRPPRPRVAPPLPGYGYPGQPPVQGYPGQPPVQGYPAAAQGYPVNVYPAPPVPPTATQWTAPGSADGDTGAR